MHLNTLIDLGLSTFGTHPLSAKSSVCLYITDAEEKNLMSARRLSEQAFLCIQRCSNLDMVLGNLLQLTLLWARGLPDDRQRSLPIISRFYEICPGWGPKPWKDFWVFHLGFKKSTTTVRLKKKYSLSGDRYQTLIEQRNSTVCVFLSVTELSEPVAVYQESDSFLHPHYKETKPRHGKLENTGLTQGSRANFWNVFSPKPPSILLISTTHTLLQKAHLATHSPFLSKWWKWACLIQQNNSVIL